MSSELTKRILTSIVLVAIVLNCLFISNYAWLVLLIVVSLISWFEFFNLTIKIYKNFFLKLILSLLNFSVLFLFAYSAYKVRNEAGELIILFIVFICSAVVADLEIWLFLNSIKYFFPSLLISNSNFSDKALTTETPTPCKPPETL